MSQRPPSSRFVLCVKNRGYPASLDVRKVYRVVPDARAASRGLVRIIDESGEDYLYPVDFFVPIEVPRLATKLFARST